MQGVWIVVIGMVFVLVAGWVGLQIRPAPFPAFPQASGQTETMPLPQNLPAPVTRFFKTVYGDTVPVIKSAVISGWADVRPGGPAFIPARFRFTHVAGQGYRHYIEAGLFGLPMMQVNERYLDGKGYGETPFGIDQGDKVDSAANLGMWAETIWMPSVFVTDPRVQWEALDDNTALLKVPMNDRQQSFVVRFNSETGLIEWFESMRYHNQASLSKTLWLNNAVEWTDLNGVKTNTAGAAVWMDDGNPWAVFHVQEMRFNVDVNEYIRASGL